MGDNFKKKNKIHQYILFIHGYYIH